VRRATDLRKHPGRLIGCIIESLDVTAFREVFVDVDGAGRLHLVDSVPVLRPDEQVLQKMLDGWRNQQLSRNLQFATIDQRLRVVQRFMNHVGLSARTIRRPGYGSHEPHLG
jgi:hypothetical protein